MVTASKTTVIELFGVGPIVAATVIGDVGEISRFPSRDHFAAYNGTAPIEVSFGGPRSLLARQGDVDEHLPIDVAHVGDRAGEGERGAGHGRSAESQGQLLQHGVGPGPVGEVPGAVGVGRDDVHEDVLGALALGVVAVMVHGHEVAGGDRTGRDARGRHGDLEHGELVTDLHHVLWSGRVGRNWWSTRSSSKVS